MTLASDKEMGGATGIYEPGCSGHIEGRNAAPQLTRCLTSTINRDTRRREIMPALNALPEAPAGISSIPLKVHRFTMAPQGAETGL
jgi:hypothetical protein